jgi:F-type H+-transporting ATPase subunit alpha
MLISCFAEQGQYDPLPTEVQVPIIFAGVNGLVSIWPRGFTDNSDYSQLDPIPVDKITKWEQEFRAHLTGSQSALLQKISEGIINPELEAEIKKVRIPKVFS